MSIYHAQTFKGLPHQFEKAPVYHRVRLLIASSRKLRQETLRKRERDAVGLQRSSIFNHPFLGGLSFRRETDFPSSSRLINSNYAAWAHDLTEKSRILTGVEKFFYDKTAGSVFASTVDRSVYDLIDATVDGAFDDQLPHCLFLPDVVSFSLSASRILMVTTLGSDPSRVNGVESVACARFMRLPDPDRISDSPRIWRGEARLMTRGPTEELMKPDTTFWVICCSFFNNDTLSRTSRDVGQSFG